MRKGKNDDPALVLNAVGVRLFACRTVEFPL